MSRSAIRAERRRTRKTSDDLELFGESPIREARREAYEKELAKIPKYLRFDMYDLEKLERFELDLHESLQDARSLGNIVRNLLAPFFASSKRSLSGSIP